MTDVIEQGGEWDCTSAAEFLDKLNSWRDHWNRAPGSWLFRGQSDEEWELLPKAYREAGKSYTDLGIRCPIKPGDSKPVGGVYQLAQKALMMRFERLLDRAALTIPAQAASFFERSSAWRSEPKQKMPEHAVPMVAFAQHLGLPTPLLDWTSSPLVAAYFALPKAPSDKAMAVWALKEDFVFDPVTLSEMGWDTQKAYMKVVTAPRSSNPNLHAQSGHFTLMEGDEAADYTVDQYMRKMAEVSNRRDGEEDDFGYPHMRKLTLPGSEAKKLQAFLWDAGINGSSMFPGPDGVIRAFKEYGVWLKA